MVIDLHWRLFRNSFLPANARLEEVGEDWINLGCERIPTLPALRLLLYLCVHGALDGWLRLKWLADIGALLHTMTPEQLASAATAAAEQQALPQFSAALILCQDLLGYAPDSLPEGFLDRNDRRVAHILRFGKQLTDLKPIPSDTGTDSLPAMVSQRIPSSQLSALSPGI